MIEVHDVPSTHYNMIDEPAVRILAEKLKKCLDRDPEQYGPVPGFSDPTLLTSSCPASDERCLAGSSVGS